MKIDKTRPSHWASLAVFGLFVALARLVRPFVRSRRERTVVLYGHRLTGNLGSIYRELADSDGALRTIQPARPAQPPVRAFFLTMDRHYHKRLIAQGIPSVLATSLPCITLLARADAVISSHGLHSMQPMVRCTSIRFFDVWHGIPFKGFDADDFRVQHRYDETWVASPLLSELYVHRFGFDPAKVIITGYARSDPLVEPQETPAEIRRRLGLQHTEGHRLVLFAPTWKQDARHRSQFPFGIDGQEFLDRLAEVCGRNGALLLFRAHLNANDPVPLPADGVIPIPFADYPDTEAILQISDVLICDWSSIAFDFLLLDRPTLFLDVEPPFRKGFSLGPEYRFGPVARNLPGLLSELEGSLSDPDGYLAAYGPRHAVVREQVYGNYADGRSAKRCVQRLSRALTTGEASR